MPRLRHREVRWQQFCLVSALESTTAVKPRLPLTDLTAVCTFAKWTFMLSRHQLLLCLCAFIACIVANCELDCMILPATAAGAELHDGLQVSIVRRHGAGRLGGQVEP